MIRSDTTSRQAGPQATQAQPLAPPPRAKPGAERKGEPSPAATTHPPAPATRLKQRSRTAPATEGRPGPAAEFLGKQAQEPQSLHAVLGVQFDDTTRTAIIALDSGQYFADRLASGKGTPTPALMDELGLFARKMTLEGSDATAALVYSTFLDHANAPALAPDLVKPVLKSLLQGPPFLPAERMAIAVKSICALFPDCRLPDEWLRTLMEVARESLAPGRSQAIADVTTAIVFAAMVVLPDPGHRLRMNQAVLRLALEDCAANPEHPIGLVAWMNGEAVHSQPMAVAARVLDELRRMPDMPPHPTASVLVTLSAGTVMPLSTDGTEPAAPLSLILPWALQLPESHRAQALAGIAQGMASDVQPAAPTMAHLQTVLRVIGEVESMIQPSDAQGWVGVILGQMIVAPQDTAAAGPARKGAAAKTGRAPKDTPGTKDTKDGKATAATAPGDRWASQVLAGLRAVLVGPKRNVVLLEHRLPLLGAALADMAGGREIHAPTLGALLAGLVRPPILVRDACQLVAGLASGAGGPAMGDPAFAAFVEALGQADRVRGATLASHFFAAIGASGAEGRKLPVPIARRMAPATATLPPPLALGCQLADAPLEAVRHSGLPRAEQLQLLEAALDVPGGLGEATLTEQVFDCGLLAAEDPDFAFEAAVRLCEQLDTSYAEPLVRQLRAALLPHVVAPAALPDGAAKVTQRLDSLARLYERASRGLWIARAQLELEIQVDGLARERKDARHASAGSSGPGPFLRSEAALMRGGPQAALLEPLAAKLETLGATLAGITVSSTLSSTPSASTPGTGGAS